MGVKKAVRTLAMGAVLAAVATLLIKMKDEKTKLKVKKLAKAADSIKNKVVVHAKKMGKLSKAAYGKIVDTTVAEYRGVKALSEADLKELKRDLKSGWSDMKVIMKEKKAKR
jgi:hypothetical protein